ncbi:cobaltochelatase subunit CobN, partial [Rhizobium ruizarguesonis]
MTTRPRTTRPISSSSERITGYEIIAPAMLRRPRVDVKLRISGFFR